MTELTTGMIFLMSSLYGAGNAHATAAAANATPVTDRNEVTISSTVPATSIITDVEAYVKQEYASTPVLIDIARCESNFKQFNLDGTVVRGKANHEDVGVMQVNEHYHANDALAKGYDLYSVEGNVAFGKYLYKKYGTEPWNFSSKCWNDGIAINSK